jgi:hypothetical protein
MTLLGDVENKFLRMAAKSITQHIKDLNPPAWIIEMMSRITKGDLGLSAETLGHGLECREYDPMMRRLLEEGRITMMDIANPCPIERWRRFVLSPGTKVEGGTLYSTSIKYMDAYIRVPYTKDAVRDLLAIGVELIMGIKGDKAVLLLVATLKCASEVAKHFKASFGDTPSDVMVAETSHEYVYSARELVPGQIEIRIVNETANDIK